MFAEPLGARPMRPGGDMLPEEAAAAASAGSAGGASSGSAGGYLPGGGASAEENVAAAAAAAAVAGMAHSFMAASPGQEGTCSTSMQLHTPMTGAAEG